MSATLANRWFVGPRASGPSRPRLVCFPYAGGGSAVFRTWPAALADFADVLAVRPPGREQRLGEDAISDARVLAVGATDALAELLAAEPARPYALFGHSLGATVAFEVARELRRRQLPMPGALVVSGRRAPSVPRTEPAIARLPREEFIAELRGLDGTPPGVFEHEELMDLLIPMLRADFAAAEEYVHSSGPPLELPIFAYGGIADTETPRAMIESWREQTVREFASRFFEGGHFFIHAAEAALLAAIRKDLTRALSPRA